jgi:hypothetical protein
VCGVFGANAVAKIGFDFTERLIAGPFGGGFIALEGAEKVLVGVFLPVYVFRAARLQLVPGVCRSLSLLGTSNVGGSASENIRNTGSSPSPPSDLEGEASEDFGRGQVRWTSRRLHELLPASTTDMSWIGPSMRTSNVRPERPTMGSRCSAASWP